MRGQSLIGFAAGLSLALLANSDATAQKLVKYQIVDETSIPASLTGKSGDATKGRAVAINRKKGNCLACHKMPIPEEQFHGEVGPDLKGVGVRYSAGELRLRLVDPKVLNPESIMPSFYKSEGFHRVMKKFQGKSIISAQEVEDIIAYLMTLKE